ncbi:MAG TPA: ATP-binding cassette domain-containing protein, partial [Candidatus Paceibacterota bacterium]|nr:ATP-binding cassette domain-containing protein [Candidatus Paceibacterota bacterium]
MIYFNKVSKFYDQSLILDDINLTINNNEFVALIGHSGAGKTTLTKLIVGEEKPTSGSVFFESKEVNKLPAGQITKLRKRIGVVFQDYRLLPHKTAYENIAFAMEAAGKTDDEITADASYVLDLVNLSDRLWHFPDQLSGGEKQRLAIARAIINQPELLIADEPTGN